MLIHETRDWAFTLKRTATYVWVHWQVDFDGLNAVSQGSVVYKKLGLRLGKDAGSSTQGVECVGVLVLDGWNILLSRGAALPVTETGVFIVVQEFIGLLNIFKDHVSAIL